MITTGRHTYIGSGPATERFNPIVKIGNFTSIGAGTCFYGTCEHPQTVSTFPFTDKGWCDESIYPKTFSRGKIAIGNDVWIGEDVKILDGITIGDGAIIGAGAIVSKSIPDYAVAVGSPIRIDRWRFSVDQVIKLKDIAWWNWSDEKIKQELPYFGNIGEFISRNEI